MECLYIPYFETSNDLIDVPPDEEKHLKALRLKIGDKINVSDGRGRIYNCSIHTSLKNQFSLKIESVSTQEIKQKISLILAKLDNKDRIEFALEKSIELGVTEIIICDTDRSSLKKLKFERLEKKAISALKQSHSYYLPNLKYAKNLSESLSLLSSESTLIFGNQFANNTFDDLKIEENDLAVVIGPEGDFSEKEIEVLKSKDAIALKINEKRLRSETAAISFLTIINYFLMGRK